MTPTTGGATASDIVRELAPDCLPSVFVRLRREGILSAVDLAGLEKEDLKELGFTMLERSRLLRWSRDNLPVETAQTWMSPKTSTPAPENASLDATRQSEFVEPPTAEEEEAEKRLDELEQQADFWCGLVRPATDDTAAQQQRSSWRFMRARTNSFSEEMEDLRENVLEGLFDLTSERVAHMFSRMQSKSSDNVVTFEALRHCLHRCGLPEFGDGELTRIIEVVCKARQECCGLKHSAFTDVQPMEFEAILSRLKLAQLLTGACALPLDSDTLGGRRRVLGSTHVGGHLTAVDYNPSSAVVANVQPARFQQFFFGHRKRPRLLGEPPLVRWVHMAGVDLTLLLALTVKYSLHPLGVEDVIEQCPTKIDRYGNHYFAAVEQLILASSVDGSEPVRVHGRHVAVFCSGPPLFDTILTVSEPDHDEKEDWPGAEGKVRSGSFGDAWVQRLRMRLDAAHSRLRERRADFLMYQILDLSSDELVKVTRAYTTRLSVLEVQPHITASGLLSDWISEVQLARQQLAVVARRLRGLQRLIRRILEDPDLTAGLSGYVGDVRDHIDEAHEDATYLSEKCRSILESSERALERHHVFCRQRAEDRLNQMVFVLTGATAIFAPVQFIAGVYGMNFVYADGTPSIPELTWTHGYLYFWTLVITYLCLSSSCAVFLHRRFKKKRKEDFNRLGDPLQSHRMIAGGVLSPRRKPGPSPGTLGNGGASSEGSPMAAPSAVGSEGSGCSHSLMPVANSSSHTGVGPSSSLGASPANGGSPVAAGVAAGATVAQVLKVPLLHPPTGAR